MVIWKFWSILVNVDLVKRPVKDPSQPLKIASGPNFSENYENFTMHQKHYSNDPSQVSSHSSKWKYFILI